MKNLIIVLVMASFISCGKENTPLSVNVDKVVRLSVVNSTGTDLLNPLLGSSYKENDITIYHEVNGVVQKVQRNVETVPGTAGPTTFDLKGFSIVRYANQNLYMMNVDLNLDGLNRNTDKYTYTYIEWPNHDVDTLKTLFHKYDDSGIWYTEFWYNGVELRKKTLDAFEQEPNDETKFFHYNIVK